MCFSIRSDKSTEEYPFHNGAVRRLALPLIMWRHCFTWRQNCRCGERYLFTLKPAIVTIRENIFKFAWYATSQHLRRCTLGFFLLQAANAHRCDGRDGEGECRAASGEPRALRASKMVMCSAWPIKRFSKSVVAFIEIRFFNILNGQIEKISVSHFLLTIVSKWPISKNILEQRNCLQIQNLATTSCVRTSPVLTDVNYYSWLPSIASRVPINDAGFEANLERGTQSMRIASFFVYVNVRYKHLLPGKLRLCNDVIQIFFYGWLTFLQEFRNFKSSLNESLDHRISRSIQSIIHAEGPIWGLFWQQTARQQWGACKSTLSSYKDFSHK